MTGKRNIQIIAPFLAEDFVDLEQPIFNIELDNWEEVRYYFKLYFECDFEKLKAEIESRLFT